MLKRTIWILVIFLLLSLRVPVVAEVFDFGERTFSSITDNESIKEGVVTAITQDENGFIWIGTQQGLVRFDGYRFTRYKFDSNDPGSLSGNYIRVLWAAPDGRIWVGTVTDGVSIFNPSTESFTRYRHNPDNPGSLSHDRVFSIVGDKQGGVWIATNNGLDFLPAKNKPFQHFKHDPKDPASINDNQVRTLLLDQDGDLWVGSKDGINRLKNRDEGFERLHSSPDNPMSLSGKRIDSMFQADDGTVWLGTKESGAAWISPDGKLGGLTVSSAESVGLKHPWIYTIGQPDTAEVWLGSMGGGIDIIDTSTLKIKQHIGHDAAINSSLNLDYVSSMFTDKSGILWIGTWGGGLNLYNPKNTAFRTLHFSPSKKGVNALSHTDIVSLLELDDGIIWIGTSGNGIDILHPDEGIIGGIRPQPDSEFGLKDGSIMAMAQTTDKTIWLGTLQAGIFRYRPEQNDFEQYTKSNGLNDNAIRYLLGDHLGRLWVGTAAGVNLFNPDKNSFQSFNSVNNEGDAPVNFLASQLDGTLWIGSDDGLYVLPNQVSSLFRVGNLPGQKGPLSHSYIASLMVDKSDQLWVVTAEGLDQLISWDGKTGIFEPVSQRAAQINQVIIADLQEDNEGNLWSAEGILNTNTWKWRRLTSADGVDLARNWVGSYAKSGNDTLLYGGDGLLMIKPTLYQEWQHQPDLVISEFKLNGKHTVIVDSKRFDLTPEIKSFSVEFSSLDFTAPDKNSYAYRLVGYDPDWIDTDAEHRIASYTNLDPGEYKLLIKGTNRLGEWSKNLLSISITVLPAWYQTFWFRSLLMILFISLLYFVYYLKVKQLQARKRALTELVRERTRDLERSNKTITTISEIGIEISATLELERVLNTVYKHVNELMDANVFWLGLYEPEKKRVVFKLAIESGKLLAPFNISMDEKARPAVRCIERQQEIIINDFEKAYREEFNAPLPVPKIGKIPASLMYWPLLVAGRIVGVLTVQSFNKNAYSEQHQDMIRSLASITAISMEHANVHQQVENKNKELKETHKALKKLSITDPLTGLKNRHFLLEQIESEVAKSLRDHQSISIADAQQSERYELLFFMLDLDHFKTVNDIYGHSAGDRILIQIKYIIERVFRDSDLKIRWGGEEFLIVVRFAHRENAPVLAERLRVAIEKYPFDIGEGKTLHKTGSIGFACFPFLKSKPDLISWSQVVDIADHNLYAAKKTQRNAWVGTITNDRTKGDDLFCKLSEDPQTLVDSGMIELMSSMTEKPLWS